MIGFEGPTREAKAAAIQKAIEDCEHALSIAEWVAERYAGISSDHPEAREASIAYAASIRLLKEAKAKAREWEV